ncbi:F0F1 ATP synthase subunit B [Candidatus Kaiserbacteria bacterium]|nr:F0F1 ATP synthase subunit B [Candidatus Kaiserbacteria bacterium]
MDQLFAAFGVNWKLLLIQAVNFGLLLSLLSYFLYKPLLKIIDERRDKVAEGVRKSEEAGRQLDDAKQEGAEMVGRAAREAEQLVATARGRADEKGLEILKTAESRADALMKDAQARAEEAKRQAMLESQKDIARAAMLAAEKILKEKAA